MSRHPPLRPILPQLPTRRVRIGQRDQQNPTSSHTPMNRQAGCASSCEREATNGWRWPANAAGRKPRVIIPSNVSARLLELVGGALHAIPASPEFSPPSRQRVRRGLFIFRMSLLAASSPCRRASNPITDGHQAVNHPRPARSPTYCSSSVCKGWSTSWFSRTATDQHCVPSEPAPGSRTRFPRSPGCKAESLAARRGNPVWALEVWRRNIPR